MKDQRLQVFRTAVDGLIESLDAVIRLSRWNDAEAEPEPLVSASAKLLDRLGTASRLSSAKFLGPATEVTKVDAMRDVLKRLDEAYVNYRKQLEPSQNDAKGAADALTALEMEIAASTARAGAWR